MFRSILGVALSLVFLSPPLLAGITPSGPEGLKRITIFERSTKTLRQENALVIEDKVFLPTEFLVAELGLVRKVLSQDQIGICLEELCIPFSKFSKGESASSIRDWNGAEYVPVQHLFKALNGTAIWLPESKELLLDLYNSSSTPDLSKASPGLTLSDVHGKSVSLSDFKGKKLVVFAWASW